MPIILTCSFSADYPERQVKNLPSKQKAADEGYDVTFVKVLEEDEHYITLDTCMSVQIKEYKRILGVSVARIAKEYYIDLVPRSSLPKQKLLLANSFGVIDKEYTGTLKAKFLKCPGYTKVDLPSRLMQIIIRKSNSFDDVVEGNLIETVRGQLGFGSSGV